MTRFQGPPTEPVTLFVALLSAFVATQSLACPPVNTGADIKSEAEDKASQTIIARLRDRKLPCGYVEFLVCSEAKSPNEHVPGFPRYAYVRMMHDAEGRYWAHQLDLRSRPKDDSQHKVFRVDPSDVLNDWVFVADGVVTHQYSPRHGTDQLGLRDPLSRADSGYLHAIYGLPPPLTMPFLSPEFVTSPKTSADGKTHEFKADNRFVITVRVEDAFVLQSSHSGSSVVASEPVRTSTHDYYSTDIVITTALIWRDEQKVRHQTPVETRLKVLHATTQMAIPTPLFDIPYPRGMRVQDNTRDGLQFTYDWQERKVWDTITPKTTPEKSRAPNLTVSQWVNTADKIELAKGKATVLEFWAHWCLPCIKGLKRVEEYQLKYKDKQVQFIAIHSADLPAEKLAALVRNLGLTFPIAQDVQTSPGNWASFQAYGASQYPSIFVVDAEGFISGRTDDPAEAIELLETALKRQNP